MREAIVLPSGKYVNITHVVFMSPYPFETRQLVQASARRRYRVTPVTGLPVELDEADARALYARLTGGAAELKLEPEAR